MIDISTWKDLFLSALAKTFAERVWFVGLQGSYARDEASDSSDIDMVVILDELTGEDIQSYHAMLDTLPHRDLICGFLSGKRELLSWEPSDLFQFYYDTLPIAGSLNELLPRIDREAVNRAIKIGACNIFHGCVHNLLHTKSEEILRSLYKSASFLVQAICFRQTGRYIRHQQELLTLVAADEQMIVRTFLSLKAGDAVDFRQSSEALLVWSQRWIEQTEQNCFPC